MMNGEPMRRATALALVVGALLGMAALTPLSKPLPFFAYPFLVLTLLGWAWSHVRHASR